MVTQAWELAGWWTATIGFGAGATFMFLLDHFATHIRFWEKEIRGSQITELSITPVEFHPGRHRYGSFRHQDLILDTKLVNTGMLLAIGITLHNLPEGIAVGAGYVLSRLFDRKGWSKKQRIFTGLGKIFSLVCLVLIILTPLNACSIVFNPGLLIYSIGLPGLLEMSGKTGKLSSLSKFLLEIKNQTGAA
jgi:hypothetical protein